MTQLQQPQWLPRSDRSGPGLPSFVQDADYGSALFTALNPLLTLLPIVLMATIHRTAIRRASIPYSINAAPSSSFRKLRVTASSHVIVLAPRRVENLDRVGPWGDLRNCGVR